MKFRFLQVHGQIEIDIGALLRQHPAQAADHLRQCQSGLRDWQRQRRAALSREVAVLAEVYALFSSQKTVKIEGFQYGKVNRFDLRALFVDDMQTDYSGNSLNYHLCFRGKP